MGQSFKQFPSNECQASNSLVDVFELVVVLIRRQNLSPVIRLISEKRVMAWGYILFSFEIRRWIRFRASVEQALNPGDIGGLYQVSFGDGVDGRQNRLAESTIANKLSPILGHA